MINKNNAVAKVNPGDLISFFDKEVGIKWNLCINFSAEFFRDLVEKLAEYTKSYDLERKRTYSFNIKF